MIHKLDPAQYWKLRAICTETQRSQLAFAQAQNALTIASKKQTAILEELKFDTSASTFTLDDDELTVSFPDTSNGK